MEIKNTVGRRKTAVARAYVSVGTGQIIVNKMDVKTYFPSEVTQIIINQAFVSTKTTGNYDVKVNVSGGGKSGQAEAVRLAIARALCEFDLELKPALRAEGFMTRDPRMVERKKYGRRKARRRFQFSKR
jgi:small subunit ribosomal protein S9